MNSQTADHQLERAQAIQQVINAMLDFVALAVREQPAIALDLQTPIELRCVLDTGQRVIAISGRQRDGQHRIVASFSLDRARLGQAMESVLAEGVNALCDRSGLPVQ